MYTAPPLTEAVSLSSGYTPPGLPAPVVLCGESAPVGASLLADLPAPSAPTLTLAAQIEILAPAESYTAPPLTEAVSLSSGYTPPGLTAPVVLCQSSAPYVDVTLLATLPTPDPPPLTLAATVIPVIPAAAQASLPLPSPQPLTLGVDVEQLLSLPDADGAGSGRTLRQQQAIPTGAAALCQHHAARPTQRRMVSEQFASMKTAASAALSHSDALGTRRTARTAAAQAIPVQAAGAARHAESIRYRVPARTAAAQAIPIRAAAAPRHAEQIRARTRRKIEAQAARPTSHCLPLDHHAARLTATRLRADQQQGQHPPPGRWWPRYDAPPLALVLLCSDDYQPRPLSCRVVLCSDMQPYCPGLDPEPSGPTIIPIQRVYYMRHDIEVVRLPGREPIPVRSLSLALDADSYAWTLNADLVGPGAIDLVDPSAGSVVLEISIDGWIWQIEVEDWSETTEFGQRGARVTGRSLTARLTDRYLPTRTYTETETRTVQQLADQELPVGWTLTWEPADWLVPAGAWSYQAQAPMAAIGRVAAAAGALIVPAMAAESLSIRPRYPVLPWQYAAAVPSLVVPEAAIRGLSTRRAAPDQADAVYIRGAEIGGVLGWVRRTGTAGADLLPDHLDPLCTHADAARALGSRLLAGAAQPPTVSAVTLPLDDGTLFPLSSLGDLIEVGLPDPVRGTVAGIRVTVEPGDRPGSVRVWQTLALGEQTSPWTRWRALVPTDPLLVGEVVADHGDGTVTVQLAGDGTLRVRGAGGIGGNVYVRGGRVEGVAPGLTTVEIEV